ncbi:NAD+ synthase [Planctomycetota bacterium]
MADSQAIADWMRAQVEKAGLNGIALGLSGGIDSALAAVLAQKACGENVLGIIMPCHSIDQDADHALRLAREFNIETALADLGPAFDALQEQLPEGTQLAQANLKPRLRMLTIYYMANTRGYMVAGTGNRSELAVGYFTKYGDGGVDMLPLGNLLKLEVREMAREVGVPEEIIDKPPSAGLWEGQTDEEEMGFTYDELDRIVARAAKADFAPETKTEQLIHNMMQRSDHKKRLPPIFEG